MVRIQSFSKPFGIKKKCRTNFFSWFSKLVVHLGVAPGATEIRIERCACNNDYCHIDNNGCAPETGQCILTNAPVMLTTGLPLDDIYERLQKQRPILPVIISDNAGRLMECSLFCTDILSFIFVPI